ncbi:hypothetical protein B7494_g7404 [Chlorociboria aeruginascens]|nr:hypothetical protein B7494_g7404 [Chlorociboria aeruginascens]
MAHKESMSGPGGYIVYNFMEKLPGTPPFDFWVGKNFTSQRNLLLTSFCEAFIEVIKHGIYHTDGKIDNMLWDSKRCYIVDFEYAIRLEDDGEEHDNLRVWTDDEYLFSGFVWKSNGKLTW